jgi:hypothetical protein
MDGQILNGRESLAYKYNLSFPSLITRLRLNNQILLRVVAMEDGMAAMFPNGIRTLVVDDDSKFVKSATELLSSLDFEGIRAFWC